MAPVIVQWSLEDEIETFFKQTSVTRVECEARARQLTKSDQVIPCENQGVCSYTVFAGHDLESVVQFRFSSLAVNDTTTTLASQIYGPLAPSITAHGSIGNGEQDLLVYLMRRMPGITHIEWQRANPHPTNSPENVACRKVFMGDVAHFMALAWQSPQPMGAESMAKLRSKYEEELAWLERTPYLQEFRTVIAECKQHLDSVFELPMVLTHGDFACTNIMVDKDTCHMVGVIDWAEAEMCPFGMNLHNVIHFAGEVNLESGWSRYDDYEDLQGVFWTRLGDEVGGLSAAQLQTIKRARTMGFLLRSGFTVRLATEPDPVTIGDDDYGRYQKKLLRAFLLDPKYKLDGVY